MAWWISSSLAPTQKILSNFSSSEGFNMSFIWSWLCFKETNIVYLCKNILWLSRLKFYHMPFFDIILSCFCAEREKIYRVTNLLFSSTCWPEFCWPFHLWWVHCYWLRNKWGMHSKFPSTFLLSSEGQLQCPLYSVTSLYTMQFIRVSLLAIQ